MAKLTFQNIFNQRKISTHIAILLFTFISIVVTIVLKSDYSSLENYLDAFILIFVQVELFLFIATKIFRKLNPGRNRKEFTRIILTQFFIFYIACFIIALAVILLFIYIKQILIGGSLTHLLPNFFHFQFWSWLKSTASGLSVGAVIFIIIQWQDALKREQKLREQNLIFQNETLKSQVNPHFLFNSLNTLSSLISTRPETAEWFIGRLSSIYRYILENGQKNRLPLESELAFISDYYDLHTVRDEGKILLDINTPDANDYFILPVSLQILIENAIKHNMATRDNPLKIEIYIEDQRIVVKNNLQKMATKLKSTSIGLKNLTERLMLSTGKTVIVEETNDYFFVKLPLLT
jgi:sensor histidine kinase YesM